MEKEIVIVKMRHSKDSDGEILFYAKDILKLMKFSRAGENNIANLRKFITELKKEDK